VYPSLQPIQTRRLEVRCSPVQIAFAQLLSLDTASFEATVDAEVDANPALERLVAGCPACGGGDACWCGGSRGRDAALGAGDDGVDELPASVSLREVLLADVLVELPAGDAALARHVVESLDKHGLLEASPAEFAAWVGVSQEQVERVLTALRLVTCAGAGASSLREHLLLELGLLDGEPGADLARCIVCDHLERLARGDVAGVAEACGTDRDSVIAARELITRRLHPYPLLDAGRTASVPRPVAPPDLAFLARSGHDGGTAGGVEVRVLEAERLRLTVDDTYRRFAARPPPGASPEDHAATVAAVGSACGFIRRVARRWETMGAVGRAVAEHQGEYLLGDRTRPLPLTRSAVAATIGVHESTVGRAVRGRRVVLPSGRIVPFGELFPVSRGAREVLQALLADEDRPLTDGELAQELSRRGHRVARRTVAKYRAELGVASVARRS
jgi:RNA polymerase sigma-54 factor